MRFKDFSATELARLPLDALKPVHNTMDKGAPDAWLQLAELVYVALVNTHSLDACERQVLATGAVAATYQIAHALGGQAFYVPKGANHGIQERNARIVAAFRGDNHRELSRQFKVSEMRIRQILAMGARA